MAVKHPLGELIQTIQDRDDLSLDKIVAQAQAAGYDLRRSNVDRLKKEPPRRLPIDTLYALAAGLRVPPRMVMRAALASAGVELDGQQVRTPEEAVIEDALLSDRDKQAILGLLGTLRRPPQPEERTTRSSRSS